MQFDFTEVINAIEERLNDNVNKSFGDLVCAKAAIENRELYVGDIEYGIGADVDSLIRYWNMEDNNNNIPVEERTPIKLFVNSYGGDLLEAFTVVDAISMSKTPVWTICSGRAYSAGFLIFTSGHKRFAYPTASFLFHEGSTGTTQIDAGKFRNYAEFYDKQLSQMKDIIMSNTKIDEKTYKEHQKDDWWMTAQEAIEMGACDEITKELM